MFHRILSSLDPEDLDRALRRWAASRQEPGGALALDGFPDELAALPGRRQAFRIVREQQVVRTGKTSVQTVSGLSSLGPERAGPEELPALNRGHWAIEN